MPTRPAEPQLSSTARENLELIAQVEQRLLRRRPPLERLGDVVASFFGSAWFIVAQAAAIAAWVWWNSPSHAAAAGGRPAAPPFDPYPYPLLSLVVGIEFILLTTFVLMNQKHQSRRNEHWAHLDLQLSLLTEQEVTKNLQVMQAIADRLGVGGPAGDQQLAEMARPVPVAAFVSEIERAREAGQPEPTETGD